MKERCAQCRAELLPEDRAVEWRGVVAQCPRASRNGREARLTKMEFEVFETLLRKRGAAISRDALFNVVYSDRPYADIPDSTDAIKVYICKMRPKLARLGICIESVGPSVGYRVTLC